MTPTPSAMPAYTTPPDPWWDMPWATLTAPARQLFWRAAPGVHVVQREDLAAAEDHDTLILRNVLTRGGDIPFFTMTSSRFRMPSSEATFTKVCDTVTAGMNEVIEGIFRTSDMMGRDFERAFPNTPFVTHLYFLSRAMPKMRVWRDKTFTYVEVKQDMAIAVESVRDAQMGLVDQDVKPIPFRGQPVVKSV